MIRFFNVSPSWSVCLMILVAFFLVEQSSAIRCYKCKGDDECDFKTRSIYIDNCTWASKCWGARIGDHFIRSCADDRCDVQLGVGSYIESKCCYTDLCNNDNFFFPNSATRLDTSVHHVRTIAVSLLLLTSISFLFNYS